MDFNFGFGNDSGGSEPGSGGIYGGSGTVPTATKATLTDSLTFVSNEATGKFNVLKGIGTVTAPSSYSLYVENYISSDLNDTQDATKSITILQDQSVNNSNTIIGGHFISVWNQTTAGVSLTEDYPIKGVMSAVQKLGAEGTCNMINYDTSSRVIAGSTVTNLYGYVFRTNGSDSPSTGTFTNMKGFFMPDLSTFYTGVPAASNRWGLYLEDVSQNYIAGSLGIGITVATARMHIVGTGATLATAGLLVQNSASAVGLAVLDSGRVGIGTATPSNKLEVVTTGIDGLAVNNGTYSINILPAGTSTLSELVTTNDGFQIISAAGYFRIGNNAAATSLIYVGDAATSLSLSGVNSGTVHMEIKSNGLIAVSENTNTILAKYNFMAANSTSDTVGDVRTYATYVGTVSTYFIEKCTVANATKGSGTWVLINSFAL